MDCNVASRKGAKADEVKFAFNTEPASHLAGA